MEFIFYGFFERSLQEGFLHGHPYEVIPGGQDRIERELGILKAGKASAGMYLCRIAETKGLVE